MATLRPFVDEALKDGGRVLVVGHSLGGAIANIAAVDFANRYGASVMLRTIGTPLAP